MRQRPRPDTLRTTGPVEISAGPFCMICMQFLRLQLVWDAFKNSKDSEYIQACDTLRIMLVIHDRFVFSVNPHLFFVFFGQ